jgi:pyruvate carboxylase
LYDGVEVTAYYDSLLAKVTAWGPDRENARLRLQRALKEFKVVGVATNIPYLQQILDSPDFILGNVDTSFLDSHKLTPLEPDVNAHSIVAIAAGLINNQEKAQKRFTNPDGMQQRPNKWREAQGAFKERSMGRWIRNI